MCVRIVTCGRTLGGIDARSIAILTVGHKALQICILQIDLPIPDYLVAHVCEGRMPSDTFAINPELLMYRKPARSYKRAVVWFTSQPKLRCFSSGLCRGSTNTDCFKIDVPERPR